MNICFNESMPDICLIISANQTRYMPVNLSVSKIQGVGRCFLVHKIIKKCQTKNCCIILGRREKLSV